MSFLRGTGLVIIGTVFLVGLIFAGLLYTFQSSIEYENLKPEVGNLILENIASNQQLNNELGEAVPYLQEYCKTHSSYSLDAELADMRIDISCGSIKAGKQAIVDEIVNESLSQVYYQDYDCEFAECLNQDRPLYLLSNDFRGYLKTKFYFSLIILVIVSVLMFLLAEHKANYFLISGILTLAAGLPFMVLKSAFSFADDYFYGVSLIFLSNSASTFVGLLFVGVIFLIVGVMWKLVGVGFRISHFFERHKEEKNEEKETISKKEVKEIVKKEITKENKESQQKKNKNSKTIKF